MEQKIRNRYSFLSKCQLLGWLIQTKLICRKARLFRFPLYLRGKKYIDLGHKLTTGVGCRLEAFSNGPKTLHFGRNIQLNDYVHICAMESVSIGNFVLMASKIYISDNSHGCYSAEGGGNSDPEIPPIDRPYLVAPVSIGDKTWIGENVCILPGTHIGRGSIIGANSVVRGTFPDYCMIVGTPAQIVKRYNSSSHCWERTHPNGNFIE